MINKNELQGMKKPTNKYGSTRARFARYFAWLKIYHIYLISILVFTYLHINTMAKIH